MTEATYCFSRRRTTMAYIRDMVAARLGRHAGEMSAPLEAGWPALASKSRAFDRYVAAGCLERPVRADMPWTSPDWEVFSTAWHGGRASARSALEVILRLATVTPDTVFESQIAERTSLRPLPTGHVVALKAA